MKKTLLIFILLLPTISFGQKIDSPKTVHVFVSLCDNINQGIIPVPELLGNGQDPKNNLYWGALYGIKNFLKNKSNTWIYESSIKPKNTNILESILFKHKSKNIYLLADAYKGEKIKLCTQDFLLASNNNLDREIKSEKKSLQFGGRSDLVVYIGHNGLMEFDVDLTYKSNPSKNIDAIILACASKKFFQNEIIKSKAYPILWTTNLMAPEAYTLESVLDIWSNNGTQNQITESAARAYNKYQKCGLSSARKLFISGID